MSGVLTAGFLLMPAADHDFEGERALSNTAVDTDVAGEPVCVHEHCPFFGQLEGGTLLQSNFSFVNSS